MANPSPSIFRLCADSFVLGNIETGEEIRTLRGHQAGIRALQFDDSKLISGSLDSTFTDSHTTALRFLTSYRHDQDLELAHRRVHFDPPRAHQWRYQRPL